MASENETVDLVADCIRHLADTLPNGVILNIAQCNFIADRIEAAYRREVEKLVKSFVKFERVSESLALAKKQLEAEVADKSKVVGELNEVRELNRRCCDENERLNGDVAELRCGIAELLDALQRIYNDECTDYGTNEVYVKWRKALEGANDEGK